MGRRTHRGAAKWVSRPTPATGRRPSVGLHGHRHNPAHPDPDHRRRPGRPRHRLPPAAAGPGAPDRRRQPPRRRQLAPALRQPSAVLAGSVRRPARDAVPWRPLALPDKDDVADFLEAYAVALRPAGPDCRPASTGSRRADDHFIAHLSATTPSTATTSSSPRGPSAAHRASPPSRPINSTRRSVNSTPASTSALTSSRPGRCSVVGASHSGCDIAFELAAQRPTILVGPDRGNIPLTGTPRSQVAMPVVVFIFRHVLTRRTRSAARRSSSAARRARRSRVKATTWPSVASSGSRPGHRCPSDGQPDARRRPGCRRRQCHLEHRLPSGLRLDRHSGLRR